MGNIIKSHPEGLICSLRMQTEKNGFGVPTWEDIRQDAIDGLKLAVVDNQYDNIAYPLRKKNNVELVQDLIEDEVWGMYKDMSPEMREVSDPTLDMADVHRASVLTPPDRPIRVCSDLGVHDWGEYMYRMSIKGPGPQPQVGYCLTCIENNTVQAACPNYFLRDHFDLSHVIQDDKTNSTSFQLPVQPLSDLVKAMNDADLVYLFETRSYKGILNKRLQDIDVGIFALQKFQGSDDNYGSITFWRYERAPLGYRVTNEGCSVADRYAAHPILIQY